MFRSHVRVDLMALVTAIIAFVFVVPGAALAATWDSPTPLYETPGYGDYVGYPFQPTISTDDNGNVHVIWRGRPESSGNYHVDHRAKTGAGRQDVEVLLDSVDAWQNPSVAADPDGGCAVGAPAKLSGGVNPADDAAGPDAFAVHLPAPGPFNLLAPPNGAVDQPRTLLLEWEASEGADNYDVYLDVATPPVTRVARDLVALEHEVRNLAGNQTYYWQVIAKDSTGTTPSEIWSFTTGAGLPPGWVEVAPMPTGPAGRAVKDGGLLMDGGDILYATKGYKVGEFYSYNVTANTWTELPPVPNGPSGKGVGKGAAGLVDGRYIYLVKGNNTQEFWRFDTDEMVFAWQQLRDVPLGTSGSKVKSGSDLVAMKAGTGQTPEYLYLLKGKQTDFMRFNPDDAVLDWELMPAAPAGGKPRWDKGSWLVARRRQQEGIFHIYAHKAKYHELWRFLADSLAWSTAPMPGMPLAGMMGKSKKAKDGSSAALADGALWALKGGNTQEFWRFSLDSLRWSEYDTIPAFGSTGKKKRVKAGGDIVAAGEGFYALKGNKTRELWRYIVPPVALAARPGRAGAMSGAAPAEPVFVSVAPNPLAGRVATLHYNLPAAGPATVRVCDAAGRTVLSRGLGRARAGAASLDLDRLGAGVYLVTVEAAGFTATRKLVVQR
ncbi:MAG: T9SS type A sorting domain-containing protein [bacterium]